ncbi:MAG: S8 family serine peptidase, partial [Raineya sp.]
MKEKILSLLFWVGVLALNAQDYRLMLQSGGKPTGITAEKYIANAPVFRNSRLDNGQYAIIQFHQIPDEQAKRTIRQNGIQLFDYLPHYAFWAYIPDNINASKLQSLGVKEVYPYSASDKISKVFLEKGTPQWAVKQKGKIDVFIQIYPNISVERAKNLLAQKSWVEVIREKAMPEVMELRIPENKINELAAVPFVFFLEPIFPDPEPENREATSNHRINFMNSEYVGGRKYDGTDIVVSMGDDGSADTHIDRQGRTNHNGTSQGGDHGDHVAGIILGAGNLNPLLKGQAPGAFLQVYSGHADIDQMPTPYNTQNVRITSHSLGEGLNAGYNTGARNADQQIRQLPELMHVFSAGNSGSAFYTITGGRKAGKNVMAVANLSKTDAISSSSSRGPAADGRLKPEIAAVGTSVLSTGENNTYNTKSGTSMACPAISGTLAALYHAHRALNSNQMPTSDLMKAILMNTADDLGNAGPDFTFGYGRVNARRAILVLEQNQYFKNDVSQSQTRTHTISVPAGTKQLKVMLYWNDYEGAASASVPLVNNLNLTVTTPSSTVFQPWILDPNNTSAVAVRGVDNINNSEQVTIDDPTAGSYTISVAGTTVPQGPQNYVVVYEFVRDEVVLTFPIGGESFSPSTSEVIRWDAWGSSGTFNLEYSTNGGSSWTSITTGLSGASRSFTWSVPN